MADPNTLQIPSTRALLTSLVTTLATSTQHSQGQSSSNPLSDASENTKSTLLTLHTVFPTDLLPALDLLDRGLVTRFVLASAPDIEQQDVNPIVEDDENQNQNENQDPPTRKRRQAVAYYVRTAQQQKSSSRSYRSHNTAAATVQGTTSYEVHLTAWNCSCPAFAFAAFPADVPLEESSGSADTEVEGAGWRFGGLTRGDGVPACKHLLACVIAEHCRGFEALVEEREVDLGEVAGWAAGWSD